jgi:amino acid adenylation domain-containing protein
MSSPAAPSRRSPASFGQASLWFLRQVMPYPSPYNTAVQFRLTGEIDADAIAAAVREIVRRHESFRTTFTVTDGTVLQVISDGTPLDMTVSDLGASADPEAEAARIARATAAEPFDLEHGPLLRVRLLRLTPREHALVVVMDHIVADGMSLGILWREIGALYRAFRAGEPSPLPPPARQYAACVEAQSRWLETPAFAKQLAYWTAHLAGAAACDLPADRPRPNVRSYRGDLAVVRIPPPVVARLRALAAADNVSLFAALLGALDVQLARYSGQNDVVVMVPVACRQRFAADETIGFFANMVVLRTEVAQEQSYRDLVQRVNKEIMAGLFRQDVPFEKVIEALRPERSLSHDPLARIAMSFLPAHGSTLDLPGVEARYEEIPNGGAKFDLHFVVSEHAEDLSVSAEYNTDIFNAGTIEAFLERYRLLLDAAGAAPSLAVADLPLLTPAERQGILVAWNETAAAYPRDATIPSLIVAAAARTPDGPAVSFDGREITYAELDRGSNRVAHSLRARGVGPGVYAGIAVERSIPMVVALLGILKAGGAYVPLDPAFPRDRLAFMAQDSGLAVLVTEDRFADLVPTPSGGLLRLDGDAAEIAARSDEPLDVPVHPESLAYVIYTSGSTGKPKGVQIPHRAVVNFLSTMAERPGFGAADRLLAVTSLSFDIAGLELWLPLTAGAHVELASRETAGSGATLRRILETGRITAMQATPSTFRLLLDAGWEGSPDLRVLIGGEATPRELADKLLDRAASVWNMYGPTETTIWSCIHRLEKNAPVFIGRPIANTQTYVLDGYLAPVPAGVVGELYIGGDGVAHGYLGRPELTAQRFVPDPFSDGPGGRLYRTGDLCRQRPGGTLEFLGRTDFQVKVRGHRIELGEIEATLAGHPAVREAVVVAYEEKPGDQQLVAYLTTTSAAAPEPPELRAHVRAQLPDYMVPARFMVLDRLPLTANNKIDRRALPAPARAQGAATGGDAGPREALELKLRGIWEEVLGVKGVGVRDSFFDLGGHSLLALKLFDRIEKSFGMKLSVASIFEAPTIERMGKILRAGGWEPKWSSLVPIQPGGSRPPFFCIHGGGAHVLFYYPMAKLLGTDQPFYGLQPAALSVNDIHHPDNRSVETMAAHYLDEIRDIQPSGPYLLGGASYGGTIALEMAQQLLAKGERTALLAMFDTYGPGYYRRPQGVAKVGAASVEAYLRLEHHAGSVMMLDPAERRPYLASKWQTAVEEAKEAFDDWRRALGRGVFTQLGRPLPPELDAVRNAVNEALARYRPRPYEGKVTLFRAHRQAPGVAEDPTLGWGSIARGGVEIVDMPGYHAAMISYPRVHVLVPELKRCIERAAAPAG